MYVGKNVGVSRAVGDSLEKVFGKRREKDAGPKLPNPNPALLPETLPSCEEKSAKVLRSGALSSKRAPLVWRFSGLPLQHLGDSGAVSKFGDGLPFYGKIGFRFRSSNRSVAQK